MLQVARRNCAGRALRERRCKKQEALWSKEIESTTKTQAYVPDILKNSDRYSKLSHSHVDNDV
jgi:hypothetical protein